MDKNILRTKRLSKEQFSLEKDPLQNAFVKRDGELKFYFCLYKLEDDFKNGFYFGLLQLHPDYPFYAPKLFMYTPNGRYEQNIPICTSFTNYHQESWSSAWNVRSLIQATISFMYANEPSYGCRTDPSQLRKKYARDSLTWNFSNDLFKKVFGETINSKLSDIVKSGIHIYDKQLMIELRKLDLQQINAKNQGQKILNPQINACNNLINKSKKPYDQLNRPLIQDRQIRQIQQVIYRIDVQNNDEIQRQNHRRLIDEQNRKKRQKTKRIIKIIGFLVVVTGFGIFVYYSSSKPASQVSNSQNILSGAQKSHGFLNWVYQLPKNLISMISNLIDTQQK